MSIKLREGNSAVSDENGLWILDALIIVFLLALTLIFFWPILFQGRILHFEDIANFYHPLRNYISEVVRTGHIPLWNPYMFGGEPLQADPQAAIFYPINVLFYILPTYTALSVSVALHFFLIGLFTYFFLRTLRLNRFSSLMGAVSFMFCGFFVVHVRHYTMLCTIAWLPLIMLFYEKFWQKRMLRYAILAGVFLGIQLMGSSGQMTYYIGLLLVFYTIMRFISFHWNDGGLNQILISVVALVLIIVVMIGIGAVQFLPSAEYSSLSPRAEGVTLDFANTYALKFHNLIGLVVPDFFGNHVKGPYWGDWNYWEMTSYVGILPLMMILFALARKRNMYTYFFTATAIVSILLALGKSTPLNPLLYHILPKYDSFRVPARFTYILAFSTSVLLGMAMEGLVIEWKRSHLSLLAKVLMILSLPIIALVIWANWKLRTSPPFYMRDVETVIFSMNLSLIFYIATVIVVILKEKGWLPDLIIKIAFLAILITDLFFFGIGYNPGQSTGKEVLARKFDFLELLKDKPKPYRILTHRSLGWELFGIHNTAAMIYREQNVIGYNPMAIKRYMDLLWLIDNRALPSDEKLDRDLNFFNFDNFSSPLVNLLNMKYIIILRSIYIDGYEQINSGLVRVYENMNCLPRAYLVPRTKILPDKADVAKELLSANFDPTRYVILEEKPSLIPAGDFPFDESSVQISSYLPEEIILKTRSDQDSFLVLSENYYPGWKAYVDGKEAEIYVANYAFRALPLKGGAHTVRFAYDPLSYKIGLIITLTTLTILIIGSLIRLFRRKRVGQF